MHKRNERPLSAKTLERFRNVLRYSDVMSRSDESLRNALEKRGVRSNDEN